MFPRSYTQTCPFHGAGHHWSIDRSDVATALPSRLEGQGRIASHLDLDPGPHSAPCSSSPHPCQLLLQLSLPTPKVWGHFDI